MNLDVLNSRGVECSQCMSACIHHMRIKGLSGGDDLDAEGAKRRIWVISRSF